MKKKKTKKLTPERHSRPWSYSRLSPVLDSYFHVVGGCGNLLSVRTLNLRSKEEEEPVDHFLPHQDLDSSTPARRDE